MSCTDAFDFSIADDLVRASAQGTVTVAVENLTGCQILGGATGYGNNVVTTVPNGPDLRYAHLHDNTVAVEMDALVLQGDLIGNQGYTGNTSNDMGGCGEHLHFEWPEGNGDPPDGVHPAQVDGESTSGFQTRTSSNSFIGSTGGPGLMLRNSYIFRGGWDTVGWTHNICPGACTLDLFTNHNWGWMQDFRIHPTVWGEFQTMHVSKWNQSEAFLVDTVFWQSWAIGGHHGTLNDRPGRKALSMAREDRSGTCPAGSIGCLSYQRFHLGYVWMNQFGYVDSVYCPDVVNETFFAVDNGDTIAVLNHFGTTEPYYDVNIAPGVDFADVLDVLANFGKSCKPAIGGKFLVGGLAGLPPAPERLAGSRTSPATWAKKTISSDLEGKNLLLARPLSQNMWFMLGFLQAANYDSKVVRTVDAGATWASFPAPATNFRWQDFAVDAGGRLWGVALNTLDNGWGTVRVYYSQNQGDSWTQVYQHVGDPASQGNRPFRIATHPTNANVMAVWGFTVSASLYLTFSTTGDPTQSANWSRVIAAALPSNSNRSQELDIVMLPSNRLVAVSPIQSADLPPAVYTSDDLGANWTPRLVFTGNSKRILGPVGRTNGSRLYVLMIDFGASPATSTVYVSTDQGLSWAPFVNQVPPRVAGVDGKGGIAYSDTENALYVLMDSDTTANDKYVMKMTPVTIDGAWQDVTADLLPFNGFAEFELTDFGQHIAVVP